MQNIYVIKLLSTVSPTFDDLAVPVANWMIEIYTEWIESVSNEVESDSLTISLRDEVAKEWNQVHSSGFGSLQGQALTGTSPGTSTGTIVAYPELPRHWGFKSFPTPAEGSTFEGKLTGLALADLILSGEVWAEGQQAGSDTWTAGVLSLATETYRAFTGTVLATDVLGTRVSRKTGVGI